MKKRILISIASLTFSLGVIAEEAASSTPASPTESCKLLVEKAKTNDFQGFLKLTRVPAGGNKKMQSRFKNMHGKYMEKIQGLTCGAEHVADTHAFVETEGTGKRRFIPFVKDGSEWKFDMKTYMAFYSDGKMPKIH